MIKIYRNEPNLINTNSKIELDFKFSEIKILKNN